jgi:hypothetical protein
MSEAWISTATAAEILELSQESARRAAHSGAVGYKRVGSRGRLLLNAADVWSLVITKSRQDGGDAAGGAAGSEEDLRKSA